MKKVVIGAGHSNYDDWISTQEKDLNLLDRSDFYKLFRSSESVDVFLAEHVFEHLTLDEGVKAAKNLYLFLKKDGYARIAVPDVYFKNE
jgi:predicted SAM-dependent methyltransferase